VIIGIDPGLKGGIVAIGDGEVIAHKMPIIKNDGKSVINAAGLADIIQSIPHEHAVVEKVHAMPGQGVTSMFNFGFGCGVIDGVLSALDVPRTYVRPQEWQRQVFVGIDKSLGKKRGLQYCRQYWPAFKWDEGTADAACIAMWFHLSGRMVR